VTVANLVLEYILANAAAIRGFAPYLSMLTNQAPDRFITPYTAAYGTSYNLDWVGGRADIGPRMHGRAGAACAAGCTADIHCCCHPANTQWAFGWCMFLTALLVLGTKESSTFNIVMTVAHLLLVVFIIIAGLVKAKPANAQPFFPFEVQGIFKGAALCFFSFIGECCFVCLFARRKQAERHGTVSGSNKAEPAASKVAVVLARRLLKCAHTRTGMCKPQPNTVQLESARSDIYPRS
jgi:hypothetical protein